MTATSSEQLSVLVSIHHPAQAHFYRPIVEELADRGHDVYVCVRDKEMTCALLDAFGIEYAVLASARESVPGKLLMQLEYEYRLLQVARQVRPDVITSIGGIEISHVAPLVGAKTIAFDDTAARTAQLVTAPSLDVVCTPAAFNRPVRGERRPYDGYHELAYLHPDRFDPDPAVLRDCGLEPDDTYFVVRFAAFDAHHDVGEHGFGSEAKRRLVQELADHGTVYVSSETPLDLGPEAVNLPVPPHRIHDLLAFADLYVGDSGTMATEAAMLGTPAVRTSSMAKEDDLSNFVELEEEYGLLYSYSETEATLEQVRSLLDQPALSAAFDRRRQQLLEDKIDVTAFAVRELESLGCEGRAETPEQEARSAISAAFT